MKKLALGIFFLMIFAFTGFFLINGGLVAAIDNAVVRFFASVRTDSGIALMKSLTKIGEGHVIFPLTGVALIIFIFYRRFEMAALLALGMWFNNLLTPWTKELFEKARPSPMLGQAGGYAYPSGHVSAAAIMFLILAIGFGSLIRRKALRIGFYILCGLCIFIVCITRMYLNVHWLSDVVGGVLLSAGIAWSLWGIVEVVKEKGERNL